jgi:hypothetical protein
MFELTDTHPDVAIQETEYVRLLGYPRGHVLEGRPKELAQWAREWYQKNGNPWIYARKADGLETADGQLIIEGTQFASDRLRNQLVEAQADDVFVVAVSAGNECEAMAHQLWLEEKPDEYFFLEVLGSAVVEHLIVSTGFRFCEWADHRRLAVLPHYSPGYPGWDISDQLHLFNLILNRRRNVFPAELRVLETGMLSPKKSLLAVFGITSQLDKVQRLTNLIPCQNCSLPYCRYRRVPYRHALPQIESVRPAQSEEFSSPPFETLAPSPLTQNAKYVTSFNALRKWSQERLNMNVLDDGTVEVQFRYEGTTCSNLGHPLEFVYHVKLGSAESGYVINHARCSPTPTDDGFKYMCEYLDKGDSFIEAIADDRPLLGKPLDEVLRWERQISPSGCFCDSTSRQHKWGLVLEVIHYALAYKGDRITEIVKRTER